MRRVVSLWLPTLATDRWAYSGKPDDAPRLNAPTLCDACSISDGTTVSTAGANEHLKSR